MKKMKLVLLAAMIIGIGSAFTTASPKTDGPWVKGPEGTGILESDAVELFGYCDHTITSQFCAFEEQSLETPINTGSSNVGSYVYSSPAK